MRKPVSSSDHQRLIASIKAYKLDLAHLDWADYPSIAIKDRPIYIGLAQIWQDLYPSIIRSSELERLPFRYAKLPIAGCKTRTNKRILTEIIDAVEGDPSQLMAGYLAVEREFKEMATSYEGAEQREQLKPGIVFENRYLDGVSCYRNVNNFDGSRWLNTVAIDFKVAFAASFRGCSFDHASLALKQTYDRFYPGRDSLLVEGEKSKPVTFNSSELTGEFSSVFFDERMRYHYLYMPQFKHVAFSGTSDEPSRLVGGFVRARFNACSLSHTQLRGEFHESEFRSTAMNAAHLSGNFSKSDWRGVVMRNTVIDANFSCVALRRVRLEHCRLGVSCTLGVNSALSGDTVELNDLIVSTHKQVVDLYLSGVDADSVIDWSKTDIGAGQFDYRQLFAAVESACNSNEVMRPQVRRALQAASNLSEAVDGLAALPKPASSRLFGWGAWKGYDALQAFAREFRRDAAAVDEGVEMMNPAAYAKLG